MTYQFLPVSFKRLMEYCQPANMFVNITRRILKFIGASTSRLRGGDGTPQVILHPFFCNTLEN